MKLSKFLNEIKHDGPWKSLNFRTKDVIIKKRKNDLLKKPDKDEEKFPKIPHYSYKKHFSKKAREIADEINKKEQWRPPA